MQCVESDSALAICPLSLECQFDINVILILLALPTNAMKKGTKTPQYKAIKCNSAGLSLSLQQVLREVTAKCFEKDLISRAGRDTANNQRELKSVRSGFLISTILDKIESHIKWYEVFMKILEEFTELDDIVQDITTSFTTASGSSSRSGKHYI